MNEHFTTQNLLDTWWLFLNTYSAQNVTVMIGEQAEPRPDYPYLSFRIISGPTPQGHDDLRSSVGNTIKVEGIRQYTLSVQAYGPRAHDILSDLQSILYTPVSASVLRQSDISIVDRGSVTDLTEVLQTDFENRASWDVIFNSVISIEQNTGCIDNVIVNDNINIEKGEVDNE